MRTTSKKVVVFDDTYHKSGRGRSRARPQLLVKKTITFCFFLGFLKIGCQADFVYKHLIILDELLENYIIFSISGDSEQRKKSTTISGNCTTTAYWGVGDILFCCMYDLKLLLFLTTPLTCQETKSKTV